MGGKWWRFLVALTVLVPASWMSRPASGAPSRLEGVPQLKHAFIIVLENEDYSASWGPASPATYLNSLVPQGAFANQYYGVSHASNDNYIAMTSGQTPTPLLYQPMAFLQKH